MVFKCECIRLLFRSYILIATYTPPTRVLFKIMNVILDLKQSYFVTSLYREFLEFQEAFVYLHIPKILEQVMI